MELEDLKSTWQSVRPQIKTVGCCNKDDVSLKKKIDIKTRLLRKFFFGELFSATCLILLATSHLWSPTKLSIIWLVSFCTIIAVGILCGVSLYFAIRNINLWDNSNSEILTAIIKVKRLYRKMELVISILIIPLLIWLSLIPPLVNALDMFIIWGLTIVCFSIEYLWYRSNVKQLNNLANWNQD